MRFPLEVVAEVRRVIAAHAARPFALGYRISVDEGHDDGLRIADSLKLIDQLIDKGINYLHASLGNALTAKPVDDGANGTIVQIIQGHLAGRVPLIAAGQIRTVAQAELGIKEGLSLVAIGQALVMDPDWVVRARDNPDAEVTLCISAHDVPRLAVPRKLWTIIDATTGWFNVTRNPEAEQTQKAALVTGADGP